MTFSAQVKRELCKVPIENAVDALAELSGVALFANAFDARALRIVTASEEFAKRASRLLKNLFGFDFDRKIIPQSGVKKYSLSLDARDKLAVIFDALGFDLQMTHVLRLNAALVEDDRARAAFVRGAFLTGGSVSDPESTYHFELVTSHYQLSREVIALLRELDVAANCVIRKGNHVVYCKESGAIEDLLTRIGAPLSAMAMMEQKMFKELRNTVNRKVNCETANLTKTVDAAAQQLHAIERLELDALPAPLREAAEARINNPEATLSELCEILGKTVSKSGLNHRYRKLCAMAEEGKQ